MLLQKLLGVLVRNLTQITTLTIEVFVERHAWVLLSENGKHIIPIVGLGKSEYTLAIALWIDETDEMEFRSVPYVDEILWRHLVHILLAFEKTTDPAGGAGRKFGTRLQDGTKVGVGKDGRNLEWWVRFLDCLPECPLGLSLGRTVDLC